MLHCGSQCARPPSTRKEWVARKPDIDESILAERACDGLHIANKHRGTDVDNPQIWWQIVREHPQSSGEQTEEPDTREDQGGENDRTQRGLRRASNGCMDRMRGGRRRRGEGRAEGEDMV